ncbi:glycosyltransferase family 2 protein [Thiotrichales bacterium 19S3-7]|nr:glycosyltransferase family 2 protein [Thiotrichales bacterium 19S3-7]MCF6801129.1 glycosyltransferase family 2 protein [Thiotrichales bacterium 19S3-11]
MAFDLSVIIIVKNEQSNIRRLLSSIQWADEIIIVDSGSTDQTLTIAKEFTDTIYFQAWLGYGKQKQFALSKATKQWVISLDADEEVTNALSEEIQTICQNDQSINAYKLIRKSFFGPKMIKHGDWKDDAPIRLFKRQKGRFSDDIVHESILVDGQIDQLQQPLYHYTYNQVSDAIAKANEYSTLGAQKLYKKAKTSSITKATIKGIWSFVRSYFIKLGFLDGKEGFVLAGCIALATYLKYVKLNELNRKVNYH